MPHVALSPFERLVLSMQLRRLADENPKLPSYAHEAEIIESGYTTLYGEVFGRTSEPELDKAVQEEVFEILGMFRALHPGHSAGEDWNPKDELYYQKFRGFDGNDSGGHYGFARFLIATFNRFTESAGELNSHGNSLAVYRPMLARWVAMDRPNEMSVAQVRMVVGDEG